VEATNVPSLAAAATGPITSERVVAAGVYVDGRRIAPAADCIGDSAAQDGWEPQGRPRYLAD
jgi:hypothetical protein